LNSADASRAVKRDLISGLLLVSTHGWDDGTEARYELVHGAPVAMAPPSGRHVVITRNIARALDRQLVGPCGAFTAGGVARVESGDQFRLPDVFVSWEPTPPVHFREPRLVVEVLSPSTEKEDRTEKLDFYRSLPSVEAIVLVWQERRRVLLVERDGERWLIRDLIGGGSFDLVGLGTRLSLDEVYEGVDLPVEAG
jgi:Uma2 family endonuclease